MAKTSGQRGADQVWPPHDQGIARLAVVSNGGGAENGRALRTLALIAVVVGLMALTTAACVLSYSSVHDFALKAGVSRSLARIYPDICDAMLVMAGCSVLALRGAGLLARLYGWLCFILLLGTVAASSVVHEADITISKRATEVTAAVFPWALVLVAFGLLLALLRHARRRRQNQRANSAAEGGGLGGARAELEPPALEAADLKPTAAEFESETYETEPGEAYGDPVSYEDTGSYGEPEPFEYVTFQAPSSRYPTTPLEPDESHGHDAPAAQSPRTTFRSTEMRLRARNPRQLQPLNPPPTKAGEPVTEADSPTTKAVTETGGSATETADEPATESGGSATEAGRPTAEAVTETGGSATEAGESGAETDRSATEAGGPVGGLPTSGYTGDTIPRGEMNAAPTIDQPAEPTAGAKHGQRGSETSSSQSGQPPELDRPRSSPTPPSG